MFDLTRQERQVILFLISMALVGVGIDFLANRYAIVRTTVCYNRDIGRIDLNKADTQTLVSICGIGEKIAQRIIEYRRENGNFNNLEELKKIKGINNYRYEKIKDSLCVR